MSPVAVKLIVALVVVGLVFINPFTSIAAVIILLAYYFFAGVDAKGIDPTTGEERVVTIHSPQMAVHHAKEQAKNAITFTSGVISVATAKANQHNTLEKRKMDHIGYSLAQDSAAKAAVRATNKAEWESKAKAIDAETEVLLADLDAFLNTLK